MTEAPGQPSADEVGRSRLKLSVAMATYNGAQYLGEQLRSLAEQSRPPDELVVCDDQSSDETLAVLADFAKTAAFECRVQRNEVRLGFRENFAKAIGLCTGDVIFMCDQDDVWVKDKLRTHEGVYLRNPSVGMVFNNAHLVDADLKPLGRTTFEEYGIDARVLEELRSKSAFSPLVRKSRVSGCTLSFRTWLWRHALPIPAEFVHDEWLALNAAILSDIAPLPEPLNLYRQHQSNAIGILEGGAPRSGQRLAREEWLKNQVVRMTVALLRFEQLQTENLQLKHADYRKYFYGYLAHTWKRVSLSKNVAKRLPVCLAELLLGNYARYTDGVRSSLSYDLRSKYFG